MTLADARDVVVVIVGMLYGAKVFLELVFWE
jgi:hypothetical protein